MIYESLLRIKYVLSHPDDFESNFIPVLLCWMKLTIEFGIELTMIIATAYENYDVYMIMDFSALIVINYIDLYYCGTIKDRIKL